MEDILSSIHMILTFFCKKYHRLLAIIMSQDPPASDFFLSPLLQHRQDNSPFLSPFANPYHLQPNHFQDFIDFRLDEPCPEVKQEAEEEPHRATDEQLGEKLEEMEEGQQSSEALSPPSNPCEAPSTKHVEVKEEAASPPFLYLHTSHTGSDMAMMIEFLVEHSQLKEEVMELEGRRISAGNPERLRAFRILSGKFRKLRKTKEQMTKYCLRKAFKFIAARRNSQVRDLEHCMRQYFQQAGGNFSIPFKKHSAEKTMNANFLKRIFSCQQFSADYRAFLEHFKSMVEQDNNKKIRYLGDLVEENLVKGEVEAVSKIKRLPWTRAILNHVLQLAVSISECSQLGSTRQPRRKTHE